MASAQHQSWMNAWGIDSTSFVTNFSLDASNDGLGFIQQSITTDAITHLGFRAGVRTGTPPTYIIGMEGVDATTGLPDGTYLGGGTPASGTFTPPADATWDGTWQWVALSNSYTPSRGELFAITIRHSSGSVDASNFLSFTRALSGRRSNNEVFPYTATLTAGTWSKAFLFNTNFGYRTASGRFGFFAQSQYTTTVSTTGHRSTMHFTVPTNHADTFKIAGIALLPTIPTTGNTFVVGLWDAAGSVIQSVTMDTDVARATGLNAMTVLFDEASLTALDAGTKYYIGVECAGSAATGVAGYKLAEAADRSQFPLGTSRGLATWNGSAWTDDDTVMPYIDLILDDVTAPAGGGGGFGLVIGG